MLTVLILGPPGPALAGQSASGELFFHPCTNCHPVPTGKQASRTLPNRFQGHKVTLTGHDVLGGKKSACAVCHDIAGGDPGKLRVVDGGLVDITGDTARVCHRCHAAKYKEWESGGHGRKGAKCTSAGCHDPHTPGWIYGQGVNPFVGTGFQFQVLSERQAFTPYASPAPEVDVETPRWLVMFATLGLLAAGGQAVRLVRGRPKA